MRLNLAMAFLFSAVTLIAAEDPVLHTPAGIVAFSPDTGAITAVTPRNATGSVWQSGASGLWSARFADKTMLDASRFHATNAVFRFSWRAGPDKGALTFSYTSIALVVRVIARSCPDGIELDAEVTPAEQTLLRLDLPGRLRFDPATVSRFVFPHKGNSGLGAAFNSRFFERQPGERPFGWKTAVCGPKGYETLCGGTLVMRDFQAPPVPLDVTDEGKRWLTPAMAARVSAAEVAVNRAPARDQADLVIADSVNGPYLSANRLGGSVGGLWRIGGGVRKEDASIALDLVSAVIEKLAASPATPRIRIGLVALTRGPERGIACDVAISDWHDRLTTIAARSRGRVTFVELVSPQAMLDAAAGSDFFCILNPYGEAVPAPRDNGLPEVLESIRSYVKAGGNWFEGGGYPFYRILRPDRYLAYAGSYPVAFSDFMHLDSRAGIAALYRVQPRTAKHPWDTANVLSEIFVPGALACGADELGGYCDHAFNTYVRPGETWRAPAVRMTLGVPVYEDLARYCEANRLTRTLADKISPEVLARLKQSVLLHLGGTCREKTAALDTLPVPALIHFADYLRGGFDKQYPDHLPVHPDFGTPAEFKAFFDRAHTLGHLVCPYTNPTWWCDHPKGPTFAREGDAPLFKDLNGKPCFESYGNGNNVGWAITFWHPAVQAANRVTVRQFTRDYPVDVLFQDQCGSRGWRYDANPASPTPYANSEGIIAMNDEDSRLVPIGTECGWDRVANYQTLLCGLTWGIMPPAGYNPTWASLFKDAQAYPPETWEIFPLALAVMHEKAIFLHHDLGQYVSNDQSLSWTLGLGYSLSYRASTTELSQDAPREWLAWLARLQKSVCAGYLGKPLRDFNHDRTPLFASGNALRRTADDGVLRATYGDVRILANLGDVPRSLDGHELPAYGFRADAPGMTAGLAPDGSGYVTETANGKTDLWIFGRPQSPVSVPVPLSGRVTFAFDGEATLDTRHTTLGASRSLSLTLPPRGRATFVPPPSELASRAPCDWPGTKPAIGIIDLGVGIAPAATSVTPGAWRGAFEASPLTKRYGLTVKTLSTYDEIAAALAAGPQGCFAVINPYGEIFPVAGPGRWRETLDSVRAYVNNGGSWWETAGYSFFRAAYRDGNTWKTERCGSAGADYLSLSIGAGAVDAPVEPLHLTETGRTWFGEVLREKVARSASVVNRSTLSSFSPITTLVSGLDSDFIGGDRLDGWGYLWRMGGFNPDPEIATAVAVAATLHQYTHPPAPPSPSGLRFLYHATLAPDSFWHRFKAW